MTKTANSNKTKRKDNNNKTTLTNKQTNINPTTNKKQITYRLSAWMGTASGWGGVRSEDQFYVFAYPPNNGDGPFELIMPADVPAELWCVFTHRRSSGIFTHVQTKSPLITHSLLLSISFSVSLFSMCPSLSPFSSPSLSPSSSLSLSVCLSLPLSLFLSVSLSLIHSLTHTNTYEHVWTHFHCQEHHRL